MSATALIAAILSIDWESIFALCDDLVDAGATDEEISDAVCGLLDMALPLPEPYEVMSDTLAAIVVPPIVTYLRSDEAVERRTTRRERRHARRAARKARRQS